MMIWQDMNRYTQSANPFTRFGTFLFDPGCRFMVMHRLCNAFSRFHPIGVLVRLWHKRLSVKYGFQIPHSTKIQAGLFLGHPGGIVINPNTSVGHNCNISQGVTIGRINRGDKKGSPTLGSRVWIGANAVVVGKITIGDDVMIAPLSFVNMDIPSKSIVMGNPAKVVGDQGSEGYINNLIP